MWIPATAASVILARMRALAAKRSNADVISVGRQRVTPVARMRSSAAADAIGGQAGTVEIDAGEPVHLQIEQSRQLDRPHRRM